MITEEELEFAYQQDMIQPLTEAWFLGGSEWSALVTKMDQSTVQVTIKKDSLFEYYTNDDPTPTPFVRFRGLAMDLTELGTEIEC